MKKETVQQFFEFLEKKEKRNEPFEMKLFLSPEKLTKEDLVVKGSLYIYDSPPIQSLPDGLEVGGNLYIDSLFLKSLPKGLKVKGNLTILKSPIKSFPEKLQVEGELVLVDMYISSTYTHREVKKMIEDGGGYVKRSIYLG